MRSFITIILLLTSIVSFSQTKVTVRSVAAGGVTTDTSHLSTRIDAKLGITDTSNKWITSISRSHDSVFFVKGGSSSFAYKDSVGSGGSSSKVYSPFISSNDSIYKRYNVLAYGLVGDGVTDNTTALNNLLTTVVNAGGTSEIFFPYTGHSYILSGALQTADSCQVCIPYTDTSGIPNAPHIILKGEGAPNTFTDWGYASTGEPRYGVILESTSTKQLGSVIGSAGDVSSILGNFTQVTFSNLWIKVRSKSGSTHVAPAMTAIDASGLEMVEISHCRIETQSPQDSSVQPLSTAYGIKTPTLNNWAHVILNDVLIHNFYYGMTVNEHVSADNITIATCYNGLQFLTGFHVADFKKINLWWNRTHILFAGTAYFRIHNLDFEEYNPPSNPAVLTSRWFNTVNDILENSGSSRGDITYQRTVAGVGTNSTLISNGSANIAAASVSAGAFTALTVTGSGGALFSSTQTSLYEVISRNTSSNASARAGLSAKNDGSGVGSLEKMSSGFTTAGIIASNDMVLRNTVSGNVDVYNSYASGDIQFAAGASSTANMKVESTGKISFPGTNTSGGTTGAQTINKVSGSVNFAAGASTLVVTNSLATTTSVIIVTVYGSDATATSARVTRASGSFTITLNAIATAETAVGFMVINNF